MLEYPSEELIEALPELEAALEDEHLVRGESLERLRSLLAALAAEDLMTLQACQDHPRGLSDHEFDVLFTRDKPVIFAFHGYPWLIHRLTYRRANHANLHVHGYREEGTTTTPFDMAVLNGLDPFHWGGTDQLAERLRRNEYEYTSHGAWW